MSRITFAFLLLSWAALGAQPVFEVLSRVPSEIGTGSDRALGRSFVDEVEAVDFDTRFRADREDRWQAWLEGARTFAIENLPQVPVVDRVLTPPEGQTANVWLENLQVEESQAAVAMPIEPEPYVWAPAHRLSFPKRKPARFFPGNFLKAANDGRQVHVNLFPVQLDTLTGRVLRLKSAEMKVDYVSKPRTFLAASTWGSDSVIVTTEAMADAATELADFQLQRTGVHSEIVTVESIARTEPAVDESWFPDGYKDRSVADDAVEPYNAATGQGYHYELARKVANFFRKRLGEGSPLQYITILGDAKMVPPSYYFSTKTDFGVQFGVTDWCYAATKQCLEPRVAIGRLPLQNTEQLRNYLSKIKRWVEFSDRAASELSIYAGKAFQSEVMVGELASLGIINSTEVDWVGARKFFRTKQNFSKSFVMNMLRGENDSPLVYYMDHGVGNQWYVERDYVSSKDILGINAAGSKVNPVVVAISCSNAAYDEGLFKDVVFAGTQYGPVSVGVALLRSKGGAVAYWGAGRPSLGSPIYKIDGSGNLDLSGGNYTIQVMGNFFDKYRKERGGTLGALTLEAVKSYLYGQGNDLSEPRHLWTYLNMVLLGDPTLRLAERKRSEKAYPVAASRTVFPKTGLFGFPEFLFDGAVTSLDLAISAATSVNQTLMRITRGGPPSSDEVLERKAIAAGETKTKIGKADRQAATLRYFVRLENAEGVPLERQVWFETTVPGQGGAVTRP